MPALRPLTLEDALGVDPLDSFETVKVLTAALRPGMLLVDDELGTPCFVLDHRIGAGAGMVRWLAENLDGPGHSYEIISFAVSRVPNVAVAAR